MMRIHPVNAIVKALEEGAVSHGTLCARVAHAMRQGVPDGVDSYRKHPNRLIDRWLPRLIQAQAVVRRQDATLMLGKALSEPQDASKEPGAARTRRSFQEGRWPPAARTTAHLDHDRGVWV